MNDIGLRFRVHRGRRKLPQDEVVNELASIKQAFLTKGQTGKILYDMLQYVRCNRRPNVQPQTIQLILATIELWLTERAVDCPDVRAYLGTAIDRAHHAINWAGKFRCSKSSTVSSFALRTERIAQTVLTVLLDELAALNRPPRPVTTVQRSLFDDCEPLP